MYLQKPDQTHWKNLW